MSACDGGRFALERVLVRICSLKLAMALGGRGGDTRCAQIHDM